MIRLRFNEDRLASFAFFADKLTGFCTAYFLTRRFFVCPGKALNSLKRSHFNSQLFREQESFRFKCEKRHQAISFAGTLLAHFAFFAGKLPGDLRSARNGMIFHLTAKSAKYAKTV